MSAPPLQRIIRARDLPAYVGLKRTRIGQLIELGKFPKPIKLAEDGRAVGWLEHELAAYQQQQLAERDGTPPPLAKLHEEPKPKPKPKRRRRRVRQT